jgi:hypothetical protein
MPIDTEDVIFSDEPIKSYKQDLFGRSWLIAASF